MQSMDYSKSVELNIDAVPSASTCSSGAQLEAAQFDNNHFPERSLSAIYIYWKAGCCNLSFIDRNEHLLERWLLLNLCCNI